MAPTVYHIKTTLLSCILIIPQSPVPSSGQPGSSLNKCCRSPATMSSLRLSLLWGRHSSQFTIHWFFSNLLSSHSWAPPESSHICCLSVLILLGLSIIYHLQWLSSVGDLIGVKSAVVLTARRPTLPADCTMGWDYAQNKDRKERKSAGHWNSSSLLTPPPSHPKIQSRSFMFLLP